MNQLEYQRELLAYDEKITLAELEVAKAEGRVRELKYQKARFSMDYVTFVLKQQQEIEKNAGGSSKS